MFRRLRTLRDLWRASAGPASIGQATKSFPGGRAYWLGLDEVQHMAGFEELAREGFQRNSDVYACISAIASAAAGIEWVLFRESGKAFEEVSDHPLYDLFAQPNPVENHEAFLETLVTHLYLAGNAYVTVAGPEQGPPQELWLLRPDRVEPYGTSAEPVAGYEYRHDFGKSARTLSLAEVGHFKFPNPLDPLVGMSPLWAAAYEVSQGNESRKWNVALLRNQARPSGALVSPQSEPFTESQVEQYKTHLKKQFQGPENAGLPLVLYGGFQWIELGKTPADMEWVASQRLSMERICSVFRVPPEIIGYHELAKYSNYREARKSFYTETVLPLMDRIKGTLNTWLVPMFDDNLYLDYDRDDIEALQDDRSQKWNQVIRAVRAGLLTPNEARREMGYTTVEGGDELQSSAWRSQADAG